MMVEQRAPKGIKMLEDPHGAYFVRLYVTLEGIRADIASVLELEPHETHDGDPCRRCAVLGRLSVDHLVLTAIVAGLE